uniref:(northern house mosquito) hypothetical protein n=1 Tax=Culex pipiens TaxID=7175 RepID=A0A8D8MUW0_CULPI
MRELVSSAVQSCQAVLLLEAGGNQLHCFRLRPSGSREQGGPKLHFEGTGPGEQAGKSPRESRIVRPLRRHGRSLEDPGPPQGGDPIRDRGRNLQYLRSTLSRVLHPRDVPLRAGHPAYADADLQRR